MTYQEEKYLAKVIHSGYINEGPMTQEFEERLAQRIGCKHVICTTSGTAALFLAIKASGMKQVLVPDLTFIATAHAATLAGAEVFLADVDERGLADLASIPVHVSGRLAKVQYGAIEDACEAFPVKPRGLAACYSFSPNKTITTGQGGAVTTDDDAFATSIRSLKNQGRTKQGTGGDDEHPNMGFNLRFTDLQAAVGMAQLDVLDDRLQRQREIHQRYAQHLDVVPFKDNETPLWTDVLVEDPAALAQKLLQNGIQSRRYWHPLHRQPSYARAGNFAGADLFADHALWLPSAFTLTDADVDEVIRCVLA